MPTVYRMLPPGLDWTELHLTTAPVSPSLALYTTRDTHTCPAASP